MDKVKPLIHQSYLWTSKKLGFMDGMQNQLPSLRTNEAEEKKVLPSPKTSYTCKITRKIQKDK